MKPVFQGACKHGLLSFCVVFAGLVAGSAGRARASMRPISQSCFSPVEMAALFSKPRKKTKGGSLAALRKERSALQRKIDLAEERLEDAKDRLADSLKVEGGRRGRSKAASNIESYIDREYDGWKCGKGIKGASLDEGGLPLYIAFQTVLLSASSQRGEAMATAAGETGEIGEASVCRLKEKPRPSEGSGRNGQTLAAGDFRLTEKEPVGQRERGFLFFSAFDNSEESERTARGLSQTGGFSAEVKEKIGKGRRPNKRYSEKALLIERQDFRGKSASLILQERPLSGLDRASENGGFTQNGEASLPSPKKGRGWFSPAFLIKQTLKTSQAPLQWGDYLSGWIFPEAEADPGAAEDSLLNKEQCLGDKPSHWPYAKFTQTTKDGKGKCEQSNSGEQVILLCKKGDHISNTKCNCTNHPDRLKPLGGHCREECSEPKSREVGATDCECPNGLVESGQNCISQAQKTCEDTEGMTWTADGQCSCDENAEAKELCQCVEPLKEETIGGKNTCVQTCPEGQERNTSSGKCEKTDKTKCTEAGHTWPASGNKCICALNTDMAAECECPGTHPVVWPKTGDPKQCLEKCTPPQTRIGDDPTCKLTPCEPGDEIKSNGVKTCECKSPNEEGDGSAANKCVNPEIKKPCKESGGKWEWDDNGKGGKCTECPKDKKPSEDKKKCVDKAECNNGDHIENTKCICDTGAGGDQETLDNNDGKCYYKCISVDRDKQTKQCCPTDKPHFYNGGCHQCPKGQTMLQNKCMAGAEEACTRDGFGYDPQSGECICKELKKDKCECARGSEVWTDKQKTLHCKEKCPNNKPHRNAEGECKPCPKGQKENKPYQNDKAFEEDGKVDQDLCEEDRHGKDEKECKQALKDIKKLLKDLDKLRKQLDKKNEEISEKEFSLMESGASSDKKQESALCWDCVRDLRALNKRLSGSQLLGNILSVGLGVAGSLYGHKEAKRSQAATNELLALQGYPSESNLGYSLAGISLGVPFAARGLHGLVQGNSWRNSYQCSPTANPYGHYYRQPASYQYAPYRMY